MSSENTTPKPFEWLAGGLFFGKGKDGIESVDSCKDVLQLLNGIDESLTSILAEPETSSGVASHTPAKTTESEKKKEGGKPSPSEFLEARLSRVRVLLYDERRSTSQNEHRWTSSTVAGSTMKALTGDSLRHLMFNLIRSMVRLSFESRKHVASVFNYLLVCGFEGSDRDLYKDVMTGFANYVKGNFDPLLTSIVKGYDCSEHGATDIGLHAGSMYRSCLKHAVLYQELVATTSRVERYVLPLMDKYVQVPNFDISSCAMESLKLVITAGSDASVVGGDEVAQKQMTETAAIFLARDYEIVWEERFNPKLLSDQANYMNKRIALQILSTVLLTRSNYAIMIKYVNSRKNLILVMHLLRDTSPHISLDAFHVFKVFVANPNKIPDVTKILKDNSPKLCAYLETLHQDKEAADTQFRDEKALIISTIRSL